jgi:cytoskeletal protein CcmA (bactofilin family)
MAEQEVFSLALKNGNPDPTKWPQLTSSTDNQLDLEGTLKLQPGVAVTKFSNDAALAGNSAQTISTEQAVKTYVDGQIGSVNTALATKATLAGNASQDFTTKNLTVQGNGNVVGSLTVQKDVKVQGNLEVTGTTLFRNIEQHQGNLELGDADTDEVRIHGKLLSSHSSGTLQVGSPMQVTGTITANKFMGDGSGLTGLSGVTQWVNGTGGAISYSGGSVGIGVTAPGFKLDVAGRTRIRQAGDTAGIWFYQTGPNQDRAFVGMASDDQVGLWGNTGANWGLVMDTTNGNVGIGTQSPDRKLVVRGGETSLQQEGWQTPTLQNGWINYGGGFNPAGYFKDSLGIIHLRGLVKNGNGTIFTLPEGYQPPNRELHGVSTHPNAAGRIDILSDGQIQMIQGNNAWISLDGITFRAGGPRFRIPPIVFEPRIPLERIGQ